jgi:hypothetical protein
MAFGAGEKGQNKPKRTKPAKAYKLRPATPPKAPSASSGKATMQLRLISAALVAVPLAILAALVAYLVVGNVA